MQEGLTFDDVLLKPQYSCVLPQDVNITSRFSRRIPLKSPIISSPMDTVTEHKMAIAMALNGGLGIIHKNLSIENQVREVKLVKRHENGFILDPVWVNDQAMVDDVYKIFKEKGYKKIPVVDKNKKLLGFITELHYMWPFDQGKRVTEIMTPVEKIPVALEDIKLEKANEIIREKKLAALCVVDKKGILKAMVTRRDLEKNKEYPQANKDSSKSLYVGAAIGVGKDSLERAHALAEFGVDVLVVDTAHGHSQGVIETVKKFKKEKKLKNIDIVAGNIATQKAAQELIKAGVDGLKVGIGPGSICTTRVIAGVGVPQITAIMDVIKGRGGEDIPIIADGGVKYSGDIVKAVAAGAQSVMLGSLLAGAEESPGQTEFIDGRMYKVYRGMGSIDAMRSGSKDRYGQAEINDSQKFVPEGIEGRIVYRGPAEKIIYQLLGGLKSGMGYNGAKDIPTLQKTAEFIKVTAAGLKESHPHDLAAIKDAPNYQQ